MVRLTCISVARNPSWYRLKRSLLKYSLDLGSAFVAEPARRREERKEKRKDEQKDRRQDGIDGRGTRRSVVPSYTAGNCRFRWISCYPTGFAEIGAKGCRVLCRSRAERNTKMHKIICLFTVRLFSVSSGPPWGPRDQHDQRQCSACTVHPVSEELGVVGRACVWEGRGGTDHQPILAAWRVEHG